MQEGKIIDTGGKIVGKHDGVFYYTVGQRKGLGIGGVKDCADGAWFVVGKDVEKNELYVSKGDQSLLYHNVLETDSFNYIPYAPAEDEFECEVRIRHRQPLQKAVCTKKAGGGIKLVFERAQRAIVEGQYAVLYRGDVCLGGGVIERKYNY